MPVYFTIISKSFFFEADGLNSKHNTQLLSKCRNFVYFVFARHAKVVNHIHYSFNLKQTAIKMLKSLCRKRKTEKILCTLLACLTLMQYRLTLSRTLFCRNPIAISTSVSSSNCIHITKYKNFVDFYRNRLNVLL